jgi:hypothetical protein
VDDYYRKHIEEIVSLFKQCEATLTAGQRPAAIIEPNQSAYLVLKMNDLGTGP